MKTKWVYWGNVKCESAEFPGCWLTAKIRPRWYWWLKRFREAFWFWRRRYEPESDPFTWRHSWEIAEYAVGFKPMRVNCGPIPKDGAE